MKKSTLRSSLESLGGRRLAAALVSAVALLSSTVAMRAADDITIDTFDTSAGAAQWVRWWGSAPQVYAWDSTVDADGNPASGSLKVTVDFNYATYGGDNQFSAIRDIGSVDGSQYTNLVFDLKWDQSSPRRTADFGFLEPGFRNSDYSQNWLAGFAVSTNEGWMHIVLPINPTAPKIDNVTGIVLKMWAGAAPGLTGTASFWVDNVRLIARTDINDPPPTMGIEKASPGLKLFASGAEQYQRQSIRTKNPEYSWVGAIDPVTYSVTIADYPGGTYAGFQTHIFLVPGSSVSSAETSVDWNQPHVIFLQIANNADGTAYAAFRYKTNEPNNNTQIWGSGTIAVVGSSTVKGTWNLTFNPDGQISLTAPSGGITNFSLSAEATALFSGPLYAYFGIQPNNPPAIGQAAVISQVQITGVANPLSETFATGTLDPAVWETSAADPAGVIPVGQDGKFWLSWTLPAKDYTVQYQDDLISPSSWGPMISPTIQLGARRMMLIHGGNEPTSLTGNMFYKMMKP